jgi:hypothetical protein
MHGFEKGALKSTGLLTPRAVGWQPLNCISVWAAGQPLDFASFK